MTTCAGMSLSARRAWIEILCLPDIIAAGPVALRKESVDRNPMAARTSSRWSVALRKESVDRNVAYLATSARLTVALRKESVDRNIADYAKPEWLRVALRKESVDRNRPGVPIPGPGGRSLSARRAWIEMPFCRRGYRRELSLSARRAWIEIVRYGGMLSEL